MRIFLLLLLFFLSAKQGSAQVEFFEDSTGVSLGYNNAFSPVLSSYSVHSFSVSGVLENGLIPLGAISAGSQMPTQFSVGLGYLEFSDSMIFDLGFSLGATLSFYDNSPYGTVFIPGIQFSLMRKFFKQSGFPFTLGITGGAEFNIFSSFIGLGYVQGFQLNDDVLPFISVVYGRAAQLEERFDIVSVGGGFNF